MCSTTMEAPCIIDDGACKYLEMPASTTSVAPLLRSQLYRQPFGVHSMIRNDR